MSKIFSRSKLLYGALFLVGLSALGVGFYYFHTQPLVQEQFAIVDFDYDRDAADIKALMQADWHWLIESEDYDVEFMLKNHAPNHHQPQYFGKMKIKVLRKNGKFVGFITYYKQSFYQGKILFLAIMPEFRGKRYGKELLDYATAQLKQDGSLYANLVTRVTNTKAQALYTRTGFKEVNRDEGFVYYEKQLK